MKLVDSQALEWIAKALRLSGRTSGQTDFDDEHLQQTMEVSRLLPGVGTFDGWLAARITMTHTVTGEVFGAEDPYDAVEDAFGPDSRQTMRVWAMWVELTRDVPAGGDAVDQARAGIRSPLTLNQPVGSRFYLIKACNQWVGPLVSGARQIGASGSGGSDFLQAARQVFVPFRIEPGGELLAASNSTIVTGPEVCSADWVLWAGPRGLNPPGVA